jgi:hypothetical protein
MTMHARIMDDDRAWIMDDDRARIMDDDCEWIMDDDCAWMVRTTKDGGNWKTISQAIKPLIEDC